MNIDKRIAAIEKSIPFFEKKKTIISAVNVAWHLDHSLKVINSVSDALKQSTPKNYRATFSFLKSFIFLTNRIPRGKAKAPNHVVSKTVILKESLEEQLIFAKNNLIEIKKLPAKSHFTHPYFGMLPLKKSLHFLAIHTNHHLKIVEEIIKKN
tara:strand:- start:501 stop:959 length:459 start_codon:yes stop_codon:yes gene_type:complete